MAVVMGRLMICVSPDGATKWTALKPEDVPEWLKHPDVMGGMADGHLAHKEDEPESPWYCAVSVPDEAVKPQSNVIDLRKPAIVHSPQALEALPNLVADAESRN